MEIITSLGDVHREATPRMAPPCTSALCRLLVRGITPHRFSRFLHPYRGIPDKPQSATVLLVQSLAKVQTSSKTVGPPYLTVRPEESDTSLSQPLVSQCTEFAQLFGHPATSGSVSSGPSHKGSIHGFAQGRCGFRFGSAPNLSSNYSRGIYTFWFLFA